MSRDGSGVVRCSGGFSPQSRVAGRGKLRDTGLPWNGVTPHTTLKSFVTDFFVPPAEHVTVTGQLPSVVLVPTLQVQEATPVELAVLGSRPAAVDGPDLYSTTILQLARGKVLTVAVA